MLCHRLRNPRFPAPGPVGSLFRLFHRHDIQAVIGGSALVGILGYRTDKPFGDWDLVTDAGVDEVKAALRDGHVRYSDESDRPSELFRSRALLEIRAGNDCKIDLIVGFRIVDPIDRQWRPVPASASDNRHGLALGCPEVWRDAYLTMARSPERRAEGKDDLAKANHLARFIEAERPAPGVELVRAATSGGFAFAM